MSMTPGTPLEHAMQKTDLPEHADRDKINALLHETYLEGWSK